MRVLLAAEARGSIEVLHHIRDGLAVRGCSTDLVLISSSSALSCVYDDVPDIRLEMRETLLCSAPRYSCIVVGLSGAKAPEIDLVLAARESGVPTIGVLDNVESLKARFPQDPSLLPDYIVVSGYQNGESFEVQLRTLYGLPVAASLIARTALVPNLRERQAEIHVKKFSDQARDEIIKKIFSRAHECRESSSNLALNSPTIVAIYTNNIPPTDHYWRSSGYTLSEIAGAFQNSLVCTQEALRVLGTRDGVHVVVRPHPNEPEGVTQPLAHKYGATFMPHG
jgi:hypothetical protein